MSTAPLFEKYYFSRPGFVTGVSRFHDLLDRQIPRGSEVLEIGAGASNPTSEFLSGHFTVQGVDVSDEVLKNAHVRRAQVYDGRTLPFDAASFDACVSYYVMEHIADPAEHFREVARVLRVGGAYFFCTPNLWHYVTLASSLTPHSVHRKWANRLRDLPEAAHEPYPTVYHANTARAIRKTAESAGLALESLVRIEFEPCYGRSHGALFYPMMMYERLVNRSRWLEAFRINIHATLRKRAA